MNRKDGHSGVGDFQLIVHVHAGICCCANRDLIKCHCSEWRYIYVCKPICVCVREWRDLTSGLGVVNKSQVFFYCEFVDLKEWLHKKTLICFLVCTVNMKRQPAAGYLSLA